MELTLNFSNFRILKAICHWRILYGYPEFILEIKSTIDIIADFISFETGKNLLHNLSPETPDWNNSLPNWDVEFRLRLFLNVNVSSWKTTSRQAGDWGWDSMRTDSVVVTVWEWDICIPPTYTNTNKKYGILSPLRIVNIEILHEIEASV